jgi:hypothetical protein
LKSANAINTTPETLTIKVNSLAGLKALSDICINRLDALKSKKTEIHYSAQKPNPTKSSKNHLNSKQTPPARSYAHSPYSYHQPGANYNAYSCYNAYSYYNGYYNATPYPDYYKGYSNEYITQSHLSPEVTADYPYIYPSP